MPTTLFRWEVRRVKISLTRGLFVQDNRAAIGISSLIIFIAMMLVAGIAASVMIQTMSSLQQQALRTGQDNRDVMPFVVGDIRSTINVSSVNFCSQGIVGVKTDNPFGS